MVDGGASKSEWPFLSWAGIDVDTLGEDTELSALTDGPCVGLCLELEAVRQKLGAGRNILLLWLAQLYGVRWPHSAPHPEAVHFSLKKLKTTHASLKKSCHRPDGQKRLDAFLDEQFMLPKTKSQQNTEKPGEDSSLISTPVHEEMELRSGSRVGSEDDKVGRLQERVDENYRRVRNLTKKLRRRDVQLDRRQEELERVEQDKNTFQHSCKEYEYELQTCEETLQRLVEKKVELDKQKTNLTRMIGYWRDEATKARDSATHHSQASASALSTVRAEHQKSLDHMNSQMRIFESSVAELEERLEEAQLPARLDTKKDGKYTDDVRQCCIALLTHNVGVNHIANVIRDVLSLVNISAEPLPSVSLLKQMIVEGRAASLIQVGEASSKD